MSKDLYVRGRRAEHYIVQRMQRKGFACMRAPASGAKAKRKRYVDVACFRKSPQNCICLAMEVKTIQSWRTVYVRENQMESLSWWRGAGCTPLIVVRTPESEYKVLFLEDLEPVEVRRGNKTEKMYKIGVRKIRFAKNLWDYVEELLSKPLDSFSS